MVIDNATYQLWVNWDDHIASEKPVPGFDTLTFYSLENYQKNLKILIQSGFQLQ